MSVLGDACDGTPTTDRNLFLLGASCNGIAPRPSKAAPCSAGTAHSTIPAAG